MLNWYRCPGLFWFRIFGWGLVIKDPARHPPLFSERNGFVRTYRILGWSVKVLSARSVP